MENKVGSEESGRRRFIRRLTTLGAAGGVATLLYGRVSEKPLMQIAQAASGGAVLIDEINNGGGTTELHSTVVGDPDATSGYAYGVFLGHDTATSGYAYGLMGVSDSIPGRGVRGWATAGSGDTCGVHGRVESPDGVGVAGYSNATSASPGMAPTGVSGEAIANGGTFTEGPWPTGVEGYAGGTSGLTMGVFGHTGIPNTAGSPNGIGVMGIAYAATGLATGVYGITYSPWGTGVVGNALATSGSNVAVYGESLSPDGSGVVGRDIANASTYGGTGVLGESGRGAGVLGQASTAYGAGVVGHAQGPYVCPIIAWATSGQTVPLQQWVTSDWTPLAVVDATGQFGIGVSAPARQLHIRGSNAVARLDRNVDSASFIFVRTNTDYSQVLKTFTFGVKATGTDAGSFFIGDMHTNVSGSSDNRILIDTSGNVGIGTTTPSSKLHVAGRVKALGYDTGDITYANGMKTTEEGEGLAFLNRQGTKIAVLDAHGNIHIKGDIIKDL